MQEQHRSGWEIGPSRRVEQGRERDGEEEETRERGNEE